MIELSIIIVNYNGKHYFKNCLDSIYALNCDFSFEIIVFDNNSSDESVAYLNKEYPEVQVIASAINYGFGIGNNKAVEHAKGNYLLLLNNDTILLNPLQPIIEFLKNHQNNGAVGIKMLNKKKDYIPSVGKFPTILNMFWMKKIQFFNSEFATGHFSKNVYETEWLSGSFIVLPKKIYETIDGFDKDYFLYVEDVDFSKRLEKQGFNRWFLPTYSYIHFVGFNIRKNPLLIKGYQLFLKKHYAGFEYLATVTALFVNSMVKKVKLMLLKNK